MKFPRTGALVDTLRLASGVTLFAFAGLHFLNHALGLWSLDAMTAFQNGRLALTRSWPGTPALALAAHLCLALWRLARLRTWRVPRSTVWHLASGAGVLALLAPHLFEAGLGPRAAGGVMTYPGVLGLLRPSGILRQFLGLGLVWAHGCAGLHFWLRGEDGWRRYSHALVDLAVLAPSAAMAGVEVAGREIARRASAPRYPSARQNGFSGWRAPAISSASARSCCSWRFSSRGRAPPGLAGAGASPFPTNRGRACCRRPGRRCWRSAGPVRRRISPFAAARRVARPDVCGCSRARTA